MDKLSQVRGVLRGVRNIAMQGIYADTFKGMEAQCVNTYRKCIATLKTVPDYEEVENLAPELTDNATMQEIGFAVETVLSLISEGARPAAGKDVRAWMHHRTCSGSPKPPMPPIPPIPSTRPWRNMRKHMKQQFRSAFGRGWEAKYSQRLEELQDEMQERIEEEQERFEENVESIEEQMEELEEKIEEMRERLEERLEEIRERYEDRIEEIQEAAEKAEEDEDESEEEEDDPEI